MSWFRDVLCWRRDYRVELCGRAGVLYTEGRRSVEVDSELLVARPGMVIYTDSIETWNTPTGPVRMTEEEKERVIRNLRASLRNSVVEWIDNADIEAS